MTSSNIHGQFLWHELETIDPAAAAVFYRQVFGWRSEAWRKDSSYTVWLSSRGPAGGMMRMPAEERAQDGASRWLSYVAVADLDATLSSVERLAGRIVTPATPLPDGGRYAVLADPQSALLGILAPPERWSGEQPVAEAFVWHELASPDHVAAFRFYRELFGWEQLGVHDMGSMGPYLIFGHNGRPLGGMFDRPASMAAPRLGWLPYVRVSSADAVAKSVDAAGGHVVDGPHQVPGGSWVVQLTDPAGAALAANQEAPQAAEAAAARKPASRGAASPRKASPRKAAVRKPVARRPARRRPGVSKSAVRRPAQSAVRKSAARKSAARKPAARKPAARKPAARKPAARKSAVRGSAARKSPTRKAGVGRSGSAASKTRRKRSGARAAASRTSSRSAPRPRNASSRPGRKRSSPKRRAPRAKTTRQSSTRRRR